MEVKIECKIEKQLLKNYWNLRIVQNIIFFTGKSTAFSPLSQGKGYGKILPWNNRDAGRLTFVLCNSSHFMIYRMVLMKPLAVEKRMAAGMSIPALRYLFYVDS